MFWKVIAVLRNIKKKIRYVKRTENFFWKRISVAHGWDFYFVMYNDYNDYTTCDDFAV